jgi:hypothetical protein
VLSEHFAAIFRRRLRGASDRGSGLFEGWAPLPGRVASRFEGCWTSGAPSQAGARVSLSRRRLIERPAILNMWCLFS